MLKVLLKWFNTKVDDSVKDFFVRNKSLTEELYRDRATSKTMTTVKKIDVLDTDKVINKNISLFFNKSEIKMYSVNFKKNLSNDIYIYYDFFIFIMISSYLEKMLDMIN